MALEFIQSKTVLLKLRLSRTVFLKNYSISKVQLTTAVISLSMENVSFIP